MTSPRFTVIIPTRNRPEHLRRAIRTALEQTFHDYEVLVSNSPQHEGTQNVLRTFVHPRLRAVVTDDDLSMPDHFEFVLGHARGSYIVFLPDDCAMSSRLLEWVDAVLHEHPTDVVTWRIFNYYTDATERERRNSMVLHPYTGGVVAVASKDALPQLFGFRENPSFPTLFNAAIRRAVLEEVRARNGRAFLAPAPDYTSCAAVLALVDEYRHIDAPLMLGGQGAGSPHENPENFRRFSRVLDVGEGPGWAPIPLLSPVNIVPESIFRVRHLMPDELGWVAPDLAAYVRSYYIRVLMHEARGFDLQRERRLLREFLATQSPAFRRKAWITLRRLDAQYRMGAGARHFVLSLPSLDRLAASRGRTVMRGVRHGFVDIAGAMRCLDTILAANLAPSGKTDRP